MLKPTMEIINIGPDLFEVHLYVSSNFVVETTCNGYALLKVLEAYLATEN